MIETGTIININQQFAEVEIPARKECEKCNACLALTPDTRVIRVVNNLKAQKGDEVKIFVYQNKTRSGFYLYIAPLLSFFLLFVFAKNYLAIKAELVQALIGFTGLVLTYLIIHLIFKKEKVRNYMIEVL